MKTNRCDSGQAERQGKRTRSGKRQKAEKQAPVASRPQWPGIRGQEALRQMALAKRSADGAGISDLHRSGMKAGSWKRPGRPASYWRFRELSLR